MKIRYFIFFVIIILFSGTVGANTFSISGNGGDATWMDYLFENTTENQGSHGVTAGRFADNFEDGDENWNVLAGKNPLNITETIAIGAYSFYFTGGNKAETFNYSNYLSNSLAPNTLSMRVYDNGTGKSNSWIVIAQNLTNSNHVIGVDTYATNVCPAANNTNFCYKVSNGTVNKFYSNLNRGSAGWHDLKFVYNGTTIKYYVDEVLFVDTRELNGLVFVYLGNAWSGVGKAYYDDVRVMETTSGSYTTWHDAGTGNGTYLLVINATDSAGSNYTVSYSNNGTGDYTQLGGTLTGNNSLTIPGAKYQKTDVRINITGTETSSLELLKIEYYDNPVQNQTYIPPSPVWVSNITGSYWVNHTYQAGSGNITDSFYILHNGTWTNGTTVSFFNASLDPEGWSNISIWAYNSSGAGTGTVPFSSDN